VTGRGGSIARFARILLLSIALVLASGLAARAADSKPRPPATGQAGSDAPVVLKADTLTHDRERGVVTATGNVELAQGDRLIVADQISYSERDDRVEASGNVTLVEPSGDVLFADHVELTDKMHDGVIANFRARLKDGSRLAANGARRTGGERTVMSKAVYSPCALCRDDPMRAPLWQIKAREVVHDEVNHDIAYYDAWLEAYGIPILYAPYFDHPDPTVDRRSGFLTPSYGHSNRLGYMLGTPYYVVLAPWRDLTITPTITTDKGPVLAFDYRENTGNGGFEISSSITRPYSQGPGMDTGLGDEVIRGHLFGKGAFDIDPSWKWGFLVERASDNSYLSNYRVVDFRQFNLSALNNRNTLTTSPYLEAIDNRSYFNATAYSFQGLRTTDVQSEIPFVLPLIDFERVGDPDENGSFYSIGANTMVLSRAAGANSRRLSLTGAWQMPLIGPIGDLYTLSTKVRGDVYHADNVVDSGDPTGNTIHQGFTGRFLPEIVLDWSYPLIRRGDGLSALIEPVAQAILSPYGGNSQNIPNEDSQDLEFDDTSLFSDDRFPGLDRVETGPRLNYGLKGSLFGDHGGRASFLFGQTAKLRQDSVLTQGSGLERNLSDYVGRIMLSPNRFLDLAYRFRLDQKTFSPRRDEVDLSAGPTFFRFNIVYVLLETQSAADNVETFTKREQVLAGATLRVTPYWRLTGGTRRDLTGGGSTLNANIGLIYEDECLRASTQANWNYITNQNVSPDRSIVFRISLKNLG
jgi:LPS-assembly protein